MSPDVIGRRQRHVGDGERRHGEGEARRATVLVVDHVARKWE